MYLIGSYSIVLKHDGRCFLIDVSFFLAPLFPINFHYSSDSFALLPFHPGINSTLLESPKGLLQIGVPAERLIGNNMKWVNWCWWLVVHKWPSLLQSIRLRRLLWAVAVLLRQCEWRRCIIFPALAVVLRQKLQCSCSRKCINISWRLACWRSRVQNSDNDLESLGICRINWIAYTRVCVCTADIIATETLGLLRLVNTSTR